jgi:hypothetical protein
VQITFFHLPFLTFFIDVPMGGGLPTNTNERNTFVNEMPDRAATQLRAQSAIMRQRTNNINSSVKPVKIPHV